MIKVFDEISSRLDQLSTNVQNLNKRMARIIAIMGASTFLFLSLSILIYLKPDQINEIFGRTNSFRPEYVSLYFAIFSVIVLIPLSYFVLRQKAIIDKEIEEYHSELNTLLIIEDTNRILGNAELSMILSKVDQDIEILSAELTALKTDIIPDDDGKK